MMTKWIVPALSLLILTASNDHTAASPETKLEPITGHPRILLDAGVRNRIQEKVQSDSLFAVWHHSIIRHAARYLTGSTLTMERNGRRMLSSAHDFTKRILVLSYAWQFTAEPAYLKKAVQDMETICSLSDWNPTHFLDAAEFTFGMSIGLDWLFEGLPAEQKMKFSSAILEKGLRPSLDSRYNGWVDRSNNWNQVCHAAMVSGALAVFEDDPQLAGLMVRRANMSNPTALASYDPDGAYPEGYGYWAFGTHFQTIMYAAMETALGEYVQPDLSTGFWRTPEYMLHMTGPSGRIFNYSDTEDRSRLNPCMFWLAGKRNEPELLRTERTYLKPHSNVSGYDMVFLMLWAEPEQFRAIPDPVRTCWLGRGMNPVMMMRSGWNKNDWYVGIKGGSPAVNHGHMDVGSFVLDANGERWAVDLGNEDYHQLEVNKLNIWSYKQQSDRWRVTRYQTRSHNIFSVDGREQYVSGAASIVHGTCTPESQSASADLTSLYAPHIKSAVRTYSLKRESFDVTDQLEIGKETSVIVWRMMTDSEVVVAEKGLIHLKKNGKSLWMSLGSNRSFTINTTNLIPSYEFELPNMNIQVVEVRIQAPANRTVYIQANFASNPDSAGIIHLNEIKSNPTQHK